MGTLAQGCSLSAEAGNPPAGGSAPWAVGGRASRSPAEFARGLVAGWSLQAQPEQRLKLRVAECPGFPGMAWASRRECRYLHWAPWT